MASSASSLVPAASSAAASSSALLDSDDDDDVPALSDTAATLQLLFQQCPPAARCANAVPVAFVSQLYAILRNRTEVDREVEERRADGSLRVLELPSCRGELLLVRAADYDGALAAAAAAAANAADRRVLDEVRRRALPACTAVRVKSADLSAALGAGRGETVAGALLRLGWMLPARQACESAPGEAPELEGAEWRWTLPRCGAMVSQLVAARTQLLRVLHRQRFGRALRSFVETKIAQGAAAAPLPFGFVLRDLQGNELVSEREAGGGSALLELTAAGKQAAERVARKRRR